MSKFKTRARTVDMLGRQQIAGIPNAISELFKNAHDAYADRVEVDYFRSDGYLWCVMMTTVWGSPEKVDTKISQNRV